MPLNKVHDILDDAFTYPYMDKAHLTRAGLLLNTVDKSRAVPLRESDVYRLLTTPTAASLSMESARELGPVVLQFDGQRDGEGRFIIAVLVVPMQEIDQIHCYPYSNNNTEKKVWPYDKHFIISGLGDTTNLNVASRSTHPMAEKEVLDEAGTTHMSSLSAIIVRFLSAVQSGTPLVKEDVSYDKLNKKRAASKKNPIKPDYLLEWK